MKFPLKDIIARIIQISGDEEKIWKQRLKIIQEKEKQTSNYLKEQTR